MPSDAFCPVLNLQLPEEISKTCQIFEAASRGAASKFVTFCGPREVATAKWVGPKYKAPAGATKEYLDTLKCPADPKEKAGWRVLCMCVCDLFFDM